MAIRVKRVYESAEAHDGERILVDRLWPRGLTKRAAAVDLWLRDIAPSTVLRRWFGHDRSRWPQFRAKYRAELSKHPELLASLAERASHGTVTLLYSARDTRFNQAVALKAILSRRVRRRTIGRYKLSD